MELSDGFGLEGRDGATWEDRLGVLGRLADRHLDPAADLRITVLRAEPDLGDLHLPISRGIAVPLEDRPLDPGLSFARGAPIDEVDVLQAIGTTTEDEPFIVKRVPMEVDRVITTHAVRVARRRAPRSPVLRLLRAARAGRGGRRPGIRL